MEFSVRNTAGNKKQADYQKSVGTLNYEISKTKKTINVKVYTKNFPWLKTKAHFKKALGF